MVNFNVECVLEKLIEFLKDNPPTLEVKKKLCEDMTGLCNLARFYIDLDDEGILPATYWNADQGSLNSNSSSPIHSSSSSSDGQPEKHNGAESATSDDYDEKAVVFGTEDGKKTFVDRIIFSVRIITDEENLIHGIDIPIHPWPWHHFRKHVIKTVASSARVPMDTIEQWINEAEPQA